MAAFTSKSGFFVRDFIDVQDSSSEVPLYFLAVYLNRAESMGWPLSMTCLTSLMVALYRQTLASTVQYLVHCLKLFSAAMTCLLLHEMRGWMWLNITN